jgi:transposase
MASKGCYKRVRGTRDKRPVGRPPDCNDQMIERICQYVRDGNYLEPSAVRAGVDKSTLYLWLKRGGLERKRLMRNDAAEPIEREAIYVKLLEALEKAEAEAEAIDIATVRAASGMQWQAAAWRLERKHQKRWGLKQRVELDAHIDGPAEKVVVYLPSNNREDKDPE